MFPVSLSAALSAPSRIVNRFRPAAGARRGTASARHRRLVAESLEPRCMLATTATLSADRSGYTRIPVTFRRPDGSVGYSNTANVGQLSWVNATGDAVAAGVPTSFKSFCIDGLQFVSGGRSTTFSGIAAVNSDSPLGGNAPIAGSRVTLLQSFWQQYGPGTAAGFVDKTDAAAFQLAVWEIINDAAPSGTRLTFDLASGQFSIGSAGRTAPAVVRATQWLAGFDSTAPARNAVALYALQSPTAQDQIVPVPLVDLDVDSNNDGRIDPVNGPLGSDDPIESQSPGRILFVNDDDDNRNGVSDVHDAGHVVGENDLAEAVLVAAPTSGAGSGSLVVTYDEAIIRLYARPDRSGGIVSGSPVAAGSPLYAEGRRAGTTLVTVTLEYGAVRVTDTVTLTVTPYPASIDVDIDSDNDDGFGFPGRSTWEETLEDHPYGIGKLIMLDNPRRPVTPIVLQIPAALPANAGSVGVRIDWDRAGGAGRILLWNTAWIDELRNPASVSAGGNRIDPGVVYRLCDLRYDAGDGLIIVYAEGVRENEQLKTLAGVEAFPKVNEMVRATLVVNGDDVTSDGVRYVVANEDSFFYQLQFRREVRNALASRGVYAFADLPRFGLQPKSREDILSLGVADDATLLMGEGSGVAGFKAMVYQDYVSGDRQYVVAFAGTDDTLMDVLDQLLSGAEGDWQNNIVQGLALDGPVRQYESAMAIGAALAKSSSIPRGHLVATGHSLGGGLASAAAVVGGMRADTFNAAWLRLETLMEPDGLGGFRERYEGSIARFVVAAGSVDAYYVDRDVLTAVQVAFSMLGGDIAPVGRTRKLDGPHDVAVTTLIVWVPPAVLVPMIDSHRMRSVLYGLLVEESWWGGITGDTLGYVEYF